MDYSAANTQLWNGIMQFTIIAATILLANVIRRKVSFVRRAVIPTAVLGGFILLAAKLLGIDSVDTVKKGLLEARWIGRMQEIDTNMILDGAHNEDGMSRFLESVSKETVTGGKHLMFSAVKDKHYSEMIKMICDSGLFEGYILVPINDERGLDVATLKEEFLKHTSCPIEAMDNLSQGIFEACMLRDAGNVIYIAGSLYLAGEILAMRI